MSKLNKIQFTGERLIPEYNKKTAFYYEHLARYFFSTQLVKNKIVLDAGCGSGYGSYILSKHGQAKKIYGIDISKESISYAKEYYQYKNINFKLGDIKKLKKTKDKSIDITTAFEVIEHIYKQNEFLQQIKRVLKKNGLLIVSTPNKYNYPKGNKFHVKELYPEEFLQLLKKYFQNVDIFYQNFELSQIIRPENSGEKETINVNEKFNLNKNILYSPSINPKKSQYLIAVCSDVKIPSLKTIAISSSKVDNFDLDEGLLSLSKQFSTIYSQLEKNQNSLKKEKNKVKQLNKNLNFIQSSKTYKLWQKYCIVKNKFEKIKNAVLKY